MTNRERADQLFAEVPGIAFLDWLGGMSGRLAEIRGPAFYHEIEVGEAEARAAVDAADRGLTFGQDLLGRLRGGD